MKSLDELMTEVETLQAEVNKKIREAGKPHIDAMLTEFFKANPTVGVLHWQAYTPYFNDGDECVFSIHGFNVLPKREKAPEEKTFVCDGEELEYVPMSEIEYSDLPDSIKALYLMQECDSMGEYYDWTNCTAKLDRYSEIFRRVFGEPHEVLAVWHKDQLFLSVSEDVEHE